MKRLVIPTLIAVAALAGLGAAHEAVGDHERAREAVRQGEILPLEKILARAREAFDGEMLEVELEEEDHAPFDGRLVYEVKMLDADGAVTELYYDARTGELLKARGHGLEEHERDHEADDEDRAEDDDDEHDDDGWDWFWD